LIRHALRGVLAQLKREAVTLEASDCAEAMRVLEQNSDVDLILLDLTAPNGDGFSALAMLRERRPTTDVVCLAGSSDMGEVMRALELGAVGYIPKSTPCEVIGRPEARDRIKRDSRRCERSLPPSTRPHPAADRSARALAAGKKQQGDRACAGVGGTDSQKSRDCHPQSAQGCEPDRGRDCSGETQVETAGADYALTGQSLRRRIASAARRRVSG
jgi:CheY-like chemotaxis protein